MLVAMVTISTISTKIGQYCVLGLLLETAEGLIDLLLSLWMNSWRTIRSQIKFVKAVQHQINSYCNPCTILDTLAMLSEHAPLLGGLGG